SGALTVTSSDADSESARRDMCIGARRGLAAPPPPVPPVPPAARCPLPAIAYRRSIRPAGLDTVWVCR
ncbi:hypothetical protein, partial [Frankia sp. CiP3]|uniref:hypothetical protein n=1 Tax=Frankia sp. CiP3 TaxID=2880971 RepID=UPI001EF62081